MNFYHSMRRECRRIMRSNPFCGWFVSISLIVLTVMLIITLAPLIMQLMAFMLLLLAVIALIYWIAEKTGFTDE